MQSSIPIFAGRLPIGVSLPELPIEKVTFCGNTVARTIGQYPGIVGLLYSIIAVQFCCFGERGTRAAIFAKI
jgi:hypothetical protein